MKTPLALLYHAVTPLPPHADILQRALIVDPATFAAQMAQLDAAGYRTMTVDEYVAAIEGRVEDADRRVLITFDDAYLHVSRTVTPMLSRHNFTAVIFAPLAHLGERNTWDARHPSLSELEIMTPRQLRAMENGPWEIACHGGRHVDLRTQPAETRKRELLEARANLIEIVRHDVRALAYPYGYHDASVRRDARAAGFHLAFTATGYGSDDRFQLARRPIQSWDRGFLFRLRTAPAGAHLYRIEEMARLALNVRHLPPRLASASRGL